MTWRRGLWGAAALLLLIGASLIALSAVTPAYTDSVAYERAQEAVRQTVYATDSPDRDAATHAFYDVLERFETRKWVYFDLGWTAVAWAALAGVGLSVSHFTAGRMTTRRGAIVVPVAALALGAFWGGLVASPLLLFDRYQLPEWSDTVGIPIFGATLVTMMLAPLVAVLTLPPLLLRRGLPKGLLGSGRGRVMTVMVTLLYLPPIAVTVYGLSAAWEPGGCLMSLGAWLLIWAQLNARALWLAPDRQETVASGYHRD